MARQDFSHTFFGSLGGKLAGIIHRKKVPPRAAISVETATTGLRCLARLSACMCTHGGGIVSVCVRACVRACVQVRVRVREPAAHIRPLVLASVASRLGMEALPVGPYVQLGLAPVLFRTPTLSAKATAQLIYAEEPRATLAGPDGPRNSLAIARRRSSVSAPEPVPQPAQLTAPPSQGVGDGI